MNTRFVIEQPKSRPAAPPSHQPTAGGEGGGPSASASPNERAASAARSSSASLPGDAPPVATNPNDPDDPIAIAYRRVGDLTRRSQHRGYATATYFYAYAYGCPKKDIEPAAGFRDQQVIGTMTGVAMAPISTASKTRVGRAGLILAGALTAAVLSTGVFAGSAKADPSQAAMSAAQSAVRDARDQVQQRQLAEHRSYRLPQISPRWLPHGRSRDCWNPKDTAAGRLKRGHEDRDFADHVRHG